MGERKMGERKMNQEKEGKNEWPRLSSCLPLNASAQVHFPFSHIPFRSSSFSLCAFAPLPENLRVAGDRLYRTFANGDCPCLLTSSVS